MPQYAQNRAPDLEQALPIYHECHPIAYHGCHVYGQNHGPSIHNYQGAQGHHVDQPAQQLFSAVLQLNSFDKRDTSSPTANNGNSLP